MGKHRFLLLAVPFLIFVSGAALSRTMAAGPAGAQSRPVPEQVTGPCRTIAGILGAYPVLEVRRTVEAVRDFRDGSELPGCRVLASGPTTGMAGEVGPDEALRVLLPQAGWKEDSRYAADGPGTTSFAYRKNGVLCMFRGGAHSRIEHGKVLISEAYEFEAGCVEEPDREGAAPGR